MQLTIAEQILVYPNQAQQQRKKYIKRLSIEQFKNISDSQIEREYKVLNSADFSKGQKTIYTNKTNKNRYIDILVYNHSRVKCKSSQKYYCNASIMKSIADGSDFAIFAQAPTPEGFAQFWEAIYEKKVKNIIMLCSFHDPRRGKQAQQYWPDQGKKLKVQHINLTVQIQQQQKLYEDYVVTHFSLEGNQGQRKVKHIHWTGWSDLKKPLGQANQKIFRGLVDECLGLANSKQMFVVHCSAGIGRTGTLGTVIDAVRCVQKFNQLSIFEIVQNLRKHRMCCVQTFQQYRFVYQQLKRYFSK